MKRVNFVSIQSAHLVPTTSTELYRVRTGYERIISHRVGRNYAGVAEQDGKVTDIDHKTKMIEVTYKDGKKDIFEFGSKYTEFQGFFVDQDREINVKLNQPIKKGDIITYHKGFFKRDPVTNQMDMSIGCVSTVALIDTDSTLEDSTEISSDLAQRLTMAPVNIRTITIPRNSQIFQYKQVGDEVKNTDPLMIFDESPGEFGADDFKNVDDETLSMIHDLNRSKPTAKFNGRIVKMEAYSGCQLTDMHSSLAAVVRQAEDLANKRNRFAHNTERADDYPPSTIMKEGSKYKGCTFDRDTVVLVYYIQEHLPCGAGDKIVVSTQLKCTVCGIFKDGTSTESGIPLDATFSADGLTRRVVLSSVFTGILSRIAERVEADVVSEYFS